VAPEATLADERASSCPEAAARSEEDQPFANSYFHFKNACSHAQIIILFWKDFFGTSTNISERGAELIQDVLGVAQKHLVVVVVEDRVVEPRIAHSHASLEEDGLLGLPHAKHRHAGDGASGVVLGCAVGGIVGSDDEAEVDIVPDVRNKIRCTTMSMGTCTTMSTTRL
jgi:hypothetical protein